MTRLALAQTLVSGTVTLQGIPHSFTASALGTATADKVPEAKNAATVASNAAAVTAARASIDKILADNSAVLSDLEITSLISNNFTTTVRVFKPIAIETIARTADGINYFIDKATTLGRGQWLVVPNGSNLTIDAPFTNYGYFQAGYGGTPVGATINIKQPYDNYYIYSNPLTSTTNLHAAFRNQQTSSDENSSIINGGNWYVRNANDSGGLGYINNGGVTSYFANTGYLLIETNGSINNINPDSGVSNNPVVGQPDYLAKICNNGQINCDNVSQYINNNGTWLGTGTCGSCSGCPTSTGPC